MSLRAAVSRSGLCLFALTFVGVGVGVGVVGGGAALAAEARRSDKLLHQATRAAGEMDFSRALNLAHTALEAGDAEPDSVWQIYRTLGELAASVGFQSDAVEAFSRALELHPGLQLSPGSSPRLREPLERARQRNAGQRLRLESSALDAQGHVQLTVLVQGDSEHLVEGGRAYAQSLPDGAFERADLSPELSSGAKLKGSWSCAQPPCAYYVALVDAHGNELLWEGTPAHPKEAATSAPSPTDLSAPLQSASPAVPAPLVLQGVARPSRSLTEHVGRAWPWAVAAVVAGGVGTYFVVRTSAEQQQFATVRANPSQYLYAQARQSESARDRDYIVAASCFGGTVLLGGVAALRW